MRHIFVKRKICALNYRDCTKPHTGVFFFEKIITIVVKVPMTYLTFCPISSSTLDDSVRRASTSLVFLTFMDNINTTIERHLFITGGNNQ